MWYVVLSYFCVGIASWIDCSITSCFVCVRGDGFKYSAILTRFDELVDA
jgi:hypothetical protein